MQSKPYIKIMVLAVLSFVLPVVPVCGQSSLIQSIDAGCYTSGYGPEKIKDGNLSTYFQKDANPCDFYLNLHFTKTLTAARFRIISDVRGINVSIGSVLNYYKTGQTTDIFYVVMPSGFTNLELTYDNQSVIKVYEVEVTELTLSSAYLPFLYDNAGNMYQRKLVLSITKSDEDSTFSQPQSDRIASREITLYPNPTQGEILLEMNDFVPDDIAEYVIYNNAGITISQGTITGTRTSINLQEQPSGLYFMIIRMNNEEQQWTIVKQ